MFTKVLSATNLGIKSVLLSVEVNISSRGMPCFDIVGLPGKSVSESKERIRAALQNSGIEFPARRITVNLAPADIHKEGSSLDFPIAVGIICGIFDIVPPKSALFFGELSLDGTVKHTKGILSHSIFAREAGFKNIFISKDCAKEASVISGIDVYPVINLSQFLRYLKGVGEIPKFEPPDYSDESKTYTEVGEDFGIENIIGHEKAKRALEISAAGGHNLLLMGPPGVGKSMLAKSLCSILPDLSEKESLEVTKIYSIVGALPVNQALMRQRPFRAPHHTISFVGMLGGGVNPKPGEISMSHRGILFMDEFSEFSRPVLEALRQPIEDGFISLVRNNKSIVFPSRFTLIASSNPCPCGYYTHPKKKCVCSFHQIQNYRKKLSGPILDRIDLFVDVLPVEEEDFMNFDKKRNIGSREFKEKVVKAREKQEKRFRDVRGAGIFTNSEMPNSYINKFCKLSLDINELFKKAISKYNLSTRAYFKLIKTARTIADLDDSDNINLNHAAESIQYRLANTS